MEVPTEEEPTEVEPIFTKDGIGFHEATKEN